MVMTAAWLIHRSRLHSVHQMMHGSSRHPCYKMNTPLTQPTTMHTNGPSRSVECGRAADRKESTPASSDLPEYSAFFRCLKAVHKIQGLWCTGRTICHDRNEGSSTAYYEELSMLLSGKCLILISSASCLL